MCDLKKAITMNPPSANGELVNKTYDHPYCCMCHICGGVPNPEKD